MNAKQLETILRDASRVYYSGESDSNVLSDSDFDHMKDQLEVLDPDNDFLSEIGAPSDNALQKVEHSMPMGSLKKINKPEEFETWRRSVSKTCRPEMAVSEKLDGISISLIYREGKFVQSITRGDGKVGDDVTHTIRNAQCFPRKISMTDRQVSVRCEALLKISDWKKNFSDKANPRNAVSGMARRTDAEGSEFIHCIAFDVVFDGSDFKTAQDRITWLITEGFATVSHQVIDADAVESAVKHLESQRPDLDFEIDGAVVSVNDIALQEELGKHKGRPYWARAWKFAAMGGHTTLLDVSWSVGSHGVITPVAKVAPVSVGGTTIQNVSLHNMDQIDRLGIRIGDKIEVVRAGDVIPFVVRVVSKGKGRLPILLAYCPVCGSGVHRDGPKMFCSNADKCEGVNSKRIQKWVKKREIMFLGDSNLETLITTGTVRTISDLYLLTPETMVAAGLGKGMAAKIHKQIEKSKACSLSDLMGSLSLDMVGRSEASNLIELGFDSLVKWKALSADVIKGLPGYQETKATRITASVKDNWDLVESVAKHLVISVVTASKNTGGKLAEASFCFTGKMENSRKKLEQMAIDAGGEVRSVSKELMYLVIADPNSMSSKAVKARKLGITLISEQHFLNMVL